MGRVAQKKNYVNNYLTLILKKNRKNMSNGYRFQGTTFYFTYPQCDISQDVALQNLREVHPLAWAVCGRERHEDGGQHLHMCGKFESKVHTRDPHHFDLVTGQHGNYQAMKKQKECVKYCTKDGDFVEFNCSVEDLLAGKSPKRTIVAQMIIDGASKQDIIDYDCGYYMEKKKQIEEFRMEIEVAAVVAPDFFDPPVVPDGYQYEAWRQVEEWLTLNLLKHRPFKQKQLWLHGPRNSGKSSLIEELENRIRVYHLAYDGHWFDDFDVDCYDLIVADEYGGQYPITLLNRLTDGSTCPLPRRGRSPMMKKKNLPVLICSNLSIDECYHKVSAVQKEGLKIRFDEVWVESPCLEWTRILPEEDEEDLPPLAQPSMDMDELSEEELNNLLN